jgi:hypothetical protein
MLKLASFAVLLTVCTLMGCKSSGSSDSSAKADVPATQPSRPIPPDSPFAKVKVGMGSDEVFATIGAPTSQNHYMTGKGFIPFHYGGDNSRMKGHWKGIGTITFSQNHAFSSGMSVMSIDYDPNEPGFERSE